MALMLRRRLPFVLGPLVIGFGYHAARQQLVANESSAPHLLNPAQVSARLRAAEESVLVDRGNGVVRYDFSQLASNDPIEDDHSEQIVQVPLVTPEDEEYSTDWHFWGVYDGHAGFSTSAKLREALIPHVVAELNKAYPAVAPQNPLRLPPDPEKPEIVDQALARAFVQLDHEIVHEDIENLLANPSRKAAIAKLPPALSGSCALLAFYDSGTRDLRLALAGDSRAVLGMRSSNGQWQARSLTADQTGSNEHEVQRIRAEHPQSEQTTCVRRGRVLGIYEPTRSFGDAVVKWARETQRRVADLFFSTRMPSNLLTPPYLTAEPVVTRTRLDPGTNPCFLVLASDGLYEMLSSDQVVSLVVDWLQAYRPSYLAQFQATPKNDSKFGRIGQLFGRQSVKRQVGDAVEDITDNKEVLKEPVSKQHMNTPPLRVATRDANVATHLVRNALGGEDYEQVSLLLSIPTPMTRNYRDDLTVTVVFFGGQADPTGNVVTNNDATSLRAKL